MPGTWSLAVSGRIWRPRPWAQTSTTSAQLPLMNRPYCLIHTALRPSPPEKLVCMAVWTRSLDPGRRTQMTWPTPLPSIATCGLRCSLTLATAWRVFRTSTSHLWYPIPHRPWCRGHRRTWVSTTPLRSSEVCPSYLHPPPLHRAPQLFQDPERGQAIRLCTTKSQGHLSGLTEISQLTQHKALYPSGMRPTSTKWGWAAQGPTGLTANVDH